jgi:hypothetical protein
MGESAVDAIHIHMRSAVFGSCERTESSLLRTSKPAVLMSVPQAKRISKRASSVARSRADLFDTGQGRQCILDGTRDQFLGFLRGGARVGHACTHEREAHVGILLERQQA